jgi:hypothetical protein
MSDWKSNLIRDGIAQEGYIAEVEGIHGELSFTYRPMLGQKADLYTDMVAKEPNAEKAYLFVCDIVADHVTGWSEAVPPSKDSMRCLKQKLLVAMYRIIRGDRASDALKASKTGDELLGKS